MFGGVPLLSGNVFGGTTNITADVNRVRRYARDGVKASGSFYYNDTQYFLGGLRASGSFKISGSTILDFDKGSFVVSGSARSGSNSQGHFTLAYPSYTKSSGSFTFTGSTIQGVKAEGSVTVGSMPTFTNSTGSFQLSVPTTFGTPASGSITVNSTMPTFSVSSGSFQVTGAFVAATTAVNGAFTLTGRTIYPTQYTGSFDLQAPATAAQRDYISFKTRGTTMIDGNSLTASLGGTTKTIQADTNRITHLSPDITMALKTLTASNNKKALSGADVGFTRARIYSDGGTLRSGVSNQDFAMSFWFYYNDTSSNTFLLLAYGTTGFTNTRHQIDLDSTIKVKYNDGTTNSTKSFSSSNTGMSTGNWYHIHINMDLGTSGEPALYVNGVEKTGTGFTAFAGSQTAISNLLIELDDGNGIHDLVIWDKLLSTSEILESYNDGIFVDYSSHSATADISSWFRFGEESDFDSFNNGDTLSGTIQFGDSIGSEEVYLETEAQFTMIQHAMNVESNKTNVQIWDQLKTDLNSEFSGWTATYVSGATEATFYVHKDAAGSSGGSVSQSESGSTFTLQSSGSGVNAIGSTLVHGDNITIEGDQFDIFTTTSGSSFPHVNAAAQFRKSIEWPATSNGQVGFSSNDFEISSFATDTAISYSGWVHFNSGGSYGDIRSIFSIWDQDNPSSTGDFAFGLYHYQNQLHLRNGNSYIGQVSYTVEADKWVHITAVMYKNLSTRPELWINGVSQTVTNWTGTGTMATPDSILFGDRFGTSG